MGLTISHGTWDGAYGGFHRWRCEIAKFAGMPPLDIMEGYYNNDLFILLEYKFPATDELCMSSLRRLKNDLPIKWSALKPNALHYLLYFGA
jgi:hypothetical protein